MTGMIFEGRLGYDPLLFSISFIVALTSSYFALYLKEKMENLFPIVTATGFGIAGFSYAFHGNGGNVLFQGKRILITFRYFHNRAVGSKNIGNTPFFEYWDSSSYPHYNDDRDIKATAAQ